MPVGSLHIYPTVIKAVLATQPLTILDLGIGKGMNGAGIRNWYSIEAVLIGVEGYEEYENPLWGASYDAVFRMEIINSLEALISHKLLPECMYPNGVFDMVIMTDVLEHFTKKDGVKVLNLIKKVAGKSALITTPYEFFEQQHENPYEAHKSHWTVKELAALGFMPVEYNGPEYGPKMIVAEYIAK